MLNSIGIFKLNDFDMSPIKDLETVNDYCTGFNLSALHPLVSVLDVSEGAWMVRNKVGAVRYNFYAVFLKEGKECKKTSCFLRFRICLLFRLYSWPFEWFESPAGV